jgi:hypothetical protein
MARGGACFGAGDRGPLGGVTLAGMNVACVALDGAAGALFKRAPDQFVPPVCPAKIFTSRGSSAGN